jgi:hypothetical protein
MNSGESTPTGHIIGVDYSGSPFDFQALMECLAEELFAERGQLLVGCATASLDEPRVEGWFRPLEGDSDAIGKIVCYQDPDIKYTPEFNLSFVQAYIPDDAVSALWPTWERIQLEIEDMNDAILSQQLGEEPANDAAPTKQQEIEKRRTEVLRLHRKGLTIREMVRRVGYSISVVKRDIAALKERGAIRDI